MEVKTIIRFVLNRSHFGILKIGFYGLAMISLNVGKRIHVACDLSRR